jgi:hypothetical protein|tara:strand:+ start:2766 stop:3083 length:318 start_codon:yes stop_codon:yes gene_type:complete
MVDIELTRDEDNQEIKVKSNKTEKDLVVYKPQDGYKLYKVKYESGAKVPSELEGSWTGPAGALAAVERHLATKRVTPRKAVNDRFKARRAEKETINATEPNTETS